MKIMVFLHGTSIMHRAGLGRTREERVHQVIEREASVLDFGSYVPVDSAVSKLQTWHAQGADILYLSSHLQASDTDKDRAVLQRYGFPPGPIYFRQPDESYADIAARLMPDVLIEDDCESIGGESQMTYPHIPPRLQAHIKSIVVPEFGGLDGLPDDIHGLLGAARDD